MGEGPKKQQISAGLLAHVDAGKTTLLQLHPRSQNRGFFILCGSETLSRDKNTTIFCGFVVAETAAYGG